MIAGYLLFKDVPTFRTFIGVALIIGAGIYIYIREKARDQMIATDTPNSCLLYTSPSPRDRG